MRVVLIGPPADRARLRARMGAASEGIEIIGEASSVDAAEADGLQADAFLVVPPSAGRTRGAAGRGSAREDTRLLEPLTPREIDVLELLAEGLPNKAIALRLGISDQTVKFHVSSICGKLGAANRTEAVRRAIRQGIIAV